MSEDTSKVLKLNEVAAMAMGINPKQEYEIAVEALKLAEKCKGQRLKATKRLAALNICRGL